MNTSKNPSAPLQFQRLDNNGLKGAGRLVLGDLNRDGRLDAAAVNDAVLDEASSDSASVLHIYIGDGAGGFREGPVEPLPHPQAGRIAPGDFNHDGQADLAFASHDSYDVPILLSDGDGGFSAMPTVVTMLHGDRPHTHSLVAADMNGDGDDDLLTTCADDNAIAVQLGQGDGKFTPAPGSPYAAGNHPYEGLRIVDLNSDGKLDAVVVNLMGRAISVLIGDGTGRLTQAPGSPLQAGERPGYCATGDLDGDGNLDIVASHDDVGLLAVHYGDGKGGFTAAQGSPITTPERSWHVAIADLDADGSAELLTGDVDSGDVCIRPGARYSGQLPQPQRVATGLPRGPQSAGGYFNLGDLNGDGKLDIVASHWDTGDAMVLLQE